MKVTEAIEAGIAPRMADGWTAAQDVLADGEWHSYVEVEAAITGTGLQPTTTNNLLREARRAGWIERVRRGRADTWIRIVR